MKQAHLEPLSYVSWPGCEPLTYAFFEIAWVDQTQVLVILRLHGIENVIKIELVPQVGPQTAMVDFIFLMGTIEYG